MTLNDGSITTSQPHQTSAAAAAAAATTAMTTPPAAEVPSVRRGRVTYLLFTSRDGGVGRRELCPGTWQRGAGAEKKKLER